MDQNPFSSPKSSTDQTHNFPVRDGEGGKNALKDAEQLVTEEDKRKIREEIVASEIIRRQQLEAEVRMELMMEEKIMGSSGDGLGNKDVNLIVSDGSFVIDSDQFKNNSNVFGEGLKQEIHDVSLGNWPFEPDPSLVVAQIAVKSMAECSQEEVLNQAMPSSGISGMKRKAEISVPSIDEETASVTSKDSLKKKWYCSLCGVSATSAGGLNLHLHGIKHKAKEAGTKTGDKASNISVDSVSINNSKQSLEQVESHVQPMKEEKGQVLHVEEEKSQVQPGEEEKSQAQPGGEEKSQAQPGEEEKSQAQPGEEEKSQAQPGEEEKSQAQPGEEEKSQVQPMEEEIAQLQLEEEKRQVAKKWECSLCRLSLTSEILLKSHLQGKKHKTKAAKLGEGQGLSDNSGKPAKEKSVDSGKWYCSLCQVSAASEKNLNDHFQGKKHKANAESFHQDTGNLDSDSIESISKDVKDVRKKSMEGEEGLKSQVNDQEIVNTVNIEEDEADTDELDNYGHDSQKMNEKPVKLWHCKMCNEGTYDEATMANHRKSRKHKNLLREIGGALIVVSNVQKEAIKGEKGSQAADAKLE